MMCWSAAGGAVVSWHQCSCTKDTCWEIRQGAGCRYPEGSSHKDEACTDSSIRCRSAHQQGSPQQAEYKSQPVLFQPRWRASIGFQGSHTRLQTLLWDWGESISYAALDKSKVIKIQFFQEWQSQPEATDPEAAIERQQVWAAPVLSHCWTSR